MRTEPEPDVVDAAFKRSYFEEGCCCINVYGRLHKRPADEDDAVAVRFYENHCRCSRNYIEVPNAD